MSPKNNSVHASFAARKKRKIEHMKLDAKQSGSQEVLDEQPIAGTRS
jgi:hypothetical protein